MTNKEALAQLEELYKKFPYHFSDNYREAVKIGAEALQELMKQEDDGK